MKKSAEVSESFQKELTGLMKRYDATMLVRKIKNSNNILVKIEEKFGYREQTELDLGTFVDQYHMYNG